MGRQCLVFTGRQVLVMLAVLVPGWPGCLGWRAIWCPRRVARGLAWGSVGCGFAGRGLGRDPWGWAGVRGGAEEGGERGYPFECRRGDAGLLVGGVAGAEPGDRAAVLCLGGELAYPGGDGGGHPGHRAVWFGVVSPG